MGKTKKRLFIGNLPSSVTELTIKKKFKKFGNATNVEIKSSNGITGVSYYAFLDLETDTTHLDSCFEKLSKKSWDGNSIKLEFAKENFLSRLQRERQEVNAKASQVKAINDVTGKNVYQQTPNYNKLQHSPSNFKYNTYTQLSTSIKFDSQEDGNLNEPLSAKLEAPGLLQKFESFSDVWKDPPEICNKKQKKTYDEAKCDNPVSQNNNCQIELLPKLQLETATLSSLSKAEEMSVHNKVKQSEAKRLKSLQERKQAYLQQKEAVKCALAAVDSKMIKTNKKIIFDDDLEDGAGIPSSTKQLDNSYNVSVNRQSGPQLFEDDGLEEDQSYNFSVRKQFEGKKGQKLLDLQSRYGNDRRFTLDDRFYESDDSADNDGEGPPKEGSLEEERRKQLEILQSIVGSNLPHSNEEKKVKASNVDNMVVHYDPTIDDHAKYEIKQEKPKKVTATLSSRLEKRLDDKLARKKQKRDFLADVPPVSHEKFYKVSENLKESLKSDGNTFSLLETFGILDEKKELSNNEETYSTKSINKTKLHKLSSNPFKWDSSDSEDEVNNVSAVPPSSSPQIQSDGETPVKAKGIKRESFFIQANDERLSEGLKFFSQVGKQYEDFSHRRREVQKIVSAKIKKNYRRSATLRLSKGGRNAKKFMSKRR